MALITDLQSEFVRASATHTALTSAKAELEAALVSLNRQQAENAGVLADLTASLKAASTLYGQYSATDQMLRLERFAGKAASIAYVKGHPDCRESEAVAAWTDAGLQATGLQALLQEANVLGTLYRTQLLQAGLIQEDTWEAQRAWIIATDIDTAMSL